MPVFAFVVFKDEHEKVAAGAFAKAGFFKARAGTALFRLLNKREFKNPVCSLCTVSGSEIVSVRLPFPASMLHLFDIAFISHFIAQLSIQKGFIKCFIPEELSNSGAFGEFKAQLNNKMLVFKSLMLPVIEAIYLSNGVKPDLLDITFISGENTSELLFLVKQLEPYIKFVNVATEDKDSVEKSLEDLCTNSGLSVYAGNEYRSLFRNSDLLINLNSSVNLSNYKLKPECIVLNLSNADIHKLQGDFTVINGLEFRFNDNQYEQLGNDVQRCYSKVKLTGILTDIMAGLMSPENYKMDSGNEAGFETAMETILKVFRQNSCKISGLLGRRSVLEIGQVFDATRKGTDKLQVKPAVPFM